MTETVLLEALAKGGITAVIILAVLAGGWRVVGAFFRQLLDGIKGNVDAVRELTAEMRTQGKDAAQRHAEMVASFGVLSERVARVEARADERDDFDDTTPVRSLRPARNGKRP